MTLPSRQRGVALIIALGSIFAAGMMSRQSIMIFSGGHYLKQSEGQSLALGAEAFARQFLYRDWESDGEDEQPADHPMEDWARYSIALPVEVGAIEAQINDLQGRLNLNNLVNDDGEVDEFTQERFERLLAALDIRSIGVEVLIDWIDEDGTATGAGGAEDGDYLTQNPPYRAANQPFTHVSELRLMDRISREDYEALRPHVAALPSSNESINVNFASPPVIRSLHERISEQEAEGIAELAREEPFLNIQDFLALPQFSGMGLDEQGLGVRSDYFQAAARVSVGDNVYRLVSFLHRSQEGEITTISRDAGQTGIITKETIQAPE